MQLTKATTDGAAIAAVVSAHLSSWIQRLTLTASQLSIILIISIIPTADHAHWTTHEDDDEDDGTEETFAGSCGHVLLYDVMSSSPALWLVLRFVSLHYGLDRPLEDFDPNKPTF